MHCSELAAGELALGLLMGAERAAAIAHVEQCENCRREVSSLAEAADLVLLLSPPIDPPAGFEARVVARLEAEASCHTPAGQDGEPLPSLRRRRLPAMAAAVAAVILTILGFRGDAGEDVVSAAEMRTVGGESVGYALVRDGDHPVVILDLPAWGALAASYGAPSEAEYWLDVERQNGTTAHIRIDAAQPTFWRAAVDAGDDIVEVAVVDKDGRVWCSGRVDR